MVDAMGWLNLVFIILMAAIYPIKKLKANVFRRKKLYQKIRTIHPILGMLIITIGLVHGYLALGTIRLHTGSLIVINLMFLALTAVLGPKVKALKKRWRSIHKGLAILLFGFVVVHLFWRSLI